MKSYKQNIYNLDPKRTLQMDFSISWWEWSRRQRRHNNAATISLMKFLLISNFKKIFKNV